jgi:hypothetical protein
MSQTQVFEITKKFIGGALEGLTITEKTTREWTVGKKVLKPCGGSPYQIVACERIS